MPFDFGKLTGRGFFPARLTSSILALPVRREGRRGFTFNAHYGPGRRTFGCEDCPEQFYGPEEAAKHAALTGHHAVLRMVQTVVPHCTDDAPEFWDDAQWHP